MDHILKNRPRRYAVSAQIREENGQQLEAIVEHAKRTDSRASKTTVIEQMIAEKFKRLKL